MKLSKGCKVEVLCRDSEEFSWRLAEVVSSKRSSCLVRYDDLSNIGEVEKVSPKEVRMLPPPVLDVDFFDVGDLVEVFDKGSWKAATILRDSGRKYCKIRLLGSCKELKADRAKIRVRQSWRGNGWVILKKGFGSSETGNTNGYQNSSSEVLPSDLRLKLLAGNDNVAAQNDVGFQESHIVSCRTLKRPSPYCSSQVKATGYDSSEYPRLVSFQHSAELEKVDDVAYPRQFLGKKYTRSSFSSKRIRYDETRREEPNGPTDLVMNHYGHYDSDTDASVGSCSIKDDSPDKFHSRILAGRDAYGCSNDAESCCNSGNDEEESLLPPEEEDVATKIHRLELHAYRSTLFALYASGSISWDQESLLTNLRLWLHISNDEHLTELKNLISTGVNLR